MVLRAGFLGSVDIRDTKSSADFKRIPLDHPRSRVLASVPGTRQALEAVLLSQIPQTATVNRRSISAPAVAYDGDPKFEPIEMTTVSRAVNTDKQILKVGDLYYLCADGVWFVSKAATGPWTVADMIPKEIYEIPISSPAHNVTYVTVEDANDDDVTFAAAAAYTGMMVAWGTTVWGSGWYYPPYYYPGAFYPAYYPYYPSYGYGARYNPWNGAYTRGGAVYGPYGGAVWCALQPDDWHLGARRRGVRTRGARGAINAYKPANRRRRFVDPGIRTSTAAGDRRPSAAGTIGRERRASPQRTGTTSR
jgi:hypothetical protein